LEFFITIYAVSDSGGMEIKMKTITFLQATIEAMQEEMRRDNAVFLMGEDMTRHGGTFGQFKGIPEEFGVERILDCPISETAIVGAAVGAAMAGMRPVVDMHFADFITVCMDEIYNQMAKIRYMFGGQTRVPVVLRCPDGLSKSAAAQHSQSVESLLLNIPGIQVVAPSNPADAKGLLESAIRSDNPVIYLEHKGLFPMKGEVPEGEALVPIGKAKIAREGKDLTMVSYSATLLKCLEVAEILAQEGISTEVVDLRTISPIDKATVLASVAKTGRLLIAHEAVKQGGVGAEISAIVAEEGIGWLDAPIARVAAPFVPVPFSPELEKFYRIFPEQIVAAARAIL
jgi:pyruvate/2-oxoglutarate/acetoin dehydrogenase E1 component